MIALLTQQAYGNATGNKCTVKNPSNETKYWVSFGGGDTCGVLRAALQADMNPPGSSVRLLSNGQDCQPTAALQNNHTYYYVWSLPTGGNEDSGSGSDSDVSSTRAEYGSDGE